MEIQDINDLTRIAYNRTADKYYESFKNEMEQKAYDRIVLDKLSKMLQPNSLICDVGCGPCGHHGKYLVDQGHSVIGIDISERCIELAKSHNQHMQFQIMDMMNTNFADNSFDSIISFYSIIYTPKEHIHKVFAEFYRILKDNGKLLVVVKKGTEEGIVDNDWYEGNKVYFKHFIESEIQNYFVDPSFHVDFIHTRKPYDFEFNVDRIYAIGTKNNL